MRILVAPDKFKGSLGAREVAESIAAGLRSVLPDAVIDIVPVADGGEGTAEVICQACSGEWVTCDAHDALGRAIQTRYVWLSASARAVIEMSEAAGLWRIAPHELDPLRADTLGVGEMLVDATGRGAAEVILGLGGSATNDGGFGLAQALGFRFCDSDDVELKGGPSALVRLARIERDVGALLRSARGKAWPRLGAISPEHTPPASFRRFAEAPLHLIAASDVRNPLLGQQGATRTFGSQKGAGPDQIELLEEALSNLADLVTRDLGVDYRNSPGAGAAGGLGFGLMSFCGASIQSGFDLVSGMLDLDAAVQRADVVITGEGMLDQQTLDGKAPAGIARLARQRGKRIFAIVGTTVEGTAALRLFDGIFPLARPPITPEQAMSQTRELLQERGRELGTVLTANERQ